MSKFRVESYHKEGDYHNCKDLDTGRTSRLDLVVAGDLPEKFGEDLQLLVGKTVEVDRLHPFVEIAHGVSIVEAL